MKDKHHQRFALKYGELRDMRCGACTDEAKGIQRVRDFRPTYFTADWTDGVLVQVRVWVSMAMKKSPVVASRKSPLVAS